MAGSAIRAASMAYSRRLSVPAPVAFQSKSVGSMNAIRPGRAINCIVTVDDAKVDKDLDASSKRILIMYRDSSTLPRETRQGILSMIKNLDKHFLELFEEGQRAGVFRGDIAEPRVLAANVLGLGHLWALQKTWHFAPEIDLETYTSAQIAYFHSQLLPVAKANQQPGNNGQPASSITPDPTSIP